MLDPLYEGCTICLHIRVVLTQRLALCAIIDPADGGVSTCKIAPCFRVVRVEKREVGRVRFRIRFGRRNRIQHKKIYRRDALVSLHIEDCMCRGKVDIGTHGCEYLPTISEVGFTTP